MSAGTREAQRAVFAAVITADGYIIWTINGNDSVNIPGPLTAADLKTAIEGITGIGTGRIYSCTETSPNQFDVVWKNYVGNLPQSTVDVSNAFQVVTGVVTPTTVAADASVDDVGITITPSGVNGGCTITFSGGTAVSGTLVLNRAGSDTDPINWDDDESTTNSKFMPFFGSTGTIASGTLTVVDNFSFSVPTVTSSTLKYVVTPAVAQQTTLNLVDATTGKLSFTIGASSPMDLTQGDAEATLMATINGGSTYGTPTVVKTGNSYLVTSPTPGLAGSQTFTKTSQTLAKAADSPTITTQVNGAASVPAITSVSASHGYGTLTPVLSCSDATDAVKSWSDDKGGTATGNSWSPTYTHAQSPITVTLNYLDPDGGAIGTPATQVITVDAEVPTGTSFGRKRKLLLRG